MIVLKTLEFSEVDIFPQGGGRAPNFYFSNARRYPEEHPPFYSLASLICNSLLPAKVKRQLQHTIINQQRATSLQHNRPPFSVPQAAAILASPPHSSHTPPRAYQDLKSTQNHGGPPRHEFDSSWERRYRSSGVSGMIADNTDNRGNGGTPAYRKNSQQDLRDGEVSVRIKKRLTGRPRISATELGAAGFRDSPYGGVYDETFDTGDFFRGIGGTPGRAVETSGVLTSSSSPPRGRYNYGRQPSLSASVSQPNGVGSTAGVSLALPGNDARRASDSAVGCHSYREYLDDMRRREDPLSFSWPRRPSVATGCTQQSLAENSMVTSADVGHLRGDIRVPRKESAALSQPTDDSVRRRSLGGSNYGESTVSRSSGRLHHREDGGDGGNGGGSEHVWEKRPLDARESGVAWEWREGDR